MADAFKQQQALLKALQDVKRLSNPAEKFYGQLVHSSEHLVSQQAGLAKAYLDLRSNERLLAGALGANTLLNQFKALQQVTADLGSRLTPQVDGFYKQTALWANITGPAIEQLKSLMTVSPGIAAIADARMVWESTASRLATRLGDTGLASLRPGLSTRLFAPMETFTQFASDTFTKIEQAGSEQRSRVLEISLRLAEEQMVSATDALDGVLTMPQDDDEVSEPRELRSPYIQREELLRANENMPAGAAASLIETSPAAEAADLSRSVLTTIIACNEARKVAGEEEIFKPTTKSLEVYIDMPWIVPVDKKSFADLVDCLYFLFYEGAGKDKLRFLTAYGGPIKEDDFDFVLCIKHLRNKWTRHDADHGKQTDIARSWSQLSDKFVWLGLPHLPITADDFRLLHIKLLEKAYEFAEKILHRLVNAGG